MLNQKHQAFATSYFTVERTSDFSHNFVLNIFYCLINFRILFYINHYPLLVLLTFSKMVLNFENAFKICTFALRLIGSHPSIRRNRKWIAIYIFITITSFTTFILLLNSVVNHDIRNGNYTDAIKNITMAIILFTLFFKFYALTRYKNTLMGLMKIIDKDYSVTGRSDSFKEKSIVLDYSKKGDKVCKFWLLTAASTGAMLPFKAFFLMALSYYEGEFKLAPLHDFIYPNIINNRKNDFYVFCTIFILHLILVFYAACMYIAFEPLVPIFLLHICGQIDILSYRLKNVMIKGKDVNEKRKKIKYICQKQQEINRFLDSVQSSFTELFEINMKNTTFIIPFAAYQIVQSLYHSELSIEFMFFLLAGLIHFFIPCYYSNLLMDKCLLLTQGASLQEAIYTCNWETESDIGIRKTVLLMLTRCSKPMTMRTIFYDVNLETFAQMCRQAYVIFNALNTI